MIWKTHWNKEMTSLLSSSAPPGISEVLLGALCIRIVWHLVERLRNYIKMAWVLFYLFTLKKFTMQMHLSPNDSQIKQWSEILSPSLVNEITLQHTFSLLPTITVQISCLSLHLSIKFWKEMSYPLWRNTWAVCQLGQTQTTRYLPQFACLRRICLRWDFLDLKLEPSFFFVKSKTEILISM